jgi:hypothetical protein
VKKQLDMAKIAKGLGAVRCGKVYAKGGYLGALGLVADVGARFRGPEGGGVRSAASRHRARATETS